jgi:hypothetical protein
MSSRLAPIRCLQCPFVTRSVECVHRCPKNSTSLPSSIRRIIQPRGWRVLAFSAGGELLIHEGIDVRLLDRRHFSQIGPTQAGDSFLSPLVPPRTMTRNG